MIEIMSTWTSYDVLMAQLVNLHAPCSLGGFVEDFCDTALPQSHSPYASIGVSKEIQFDDGVIVIRLTVILGKSR